MDKYQKETEKVLLNHEKEVFKQLKKTYVNALAEIKQNIAQLKDDIDKLILEDPDNKSLIQSKIYQYDYQKTMEEQLNEILDVVKKNNVNNVQTFLKNMYEDSFLSINYHLQQKGIPVIMPINHKMVVDTINTPTEKLKFSTRLYKHVEDLKKTVKAEISRGIATGSSYRDIARQVSDVARIDLNKAYRIARTEGGRVSSNAKLNSMREAKKRGADIVKVWDATLDGNTRYLHRELDQQWAEIDKPFKVRGTEVMCPHGFGIASEDVNCRCSLLSVPRWDLEDEVVKLDNISGELIKTKNYQDWKEKYYNTVKTKSSKIVTTLEYKKLTEKQIETFQKSSDKCYNKLNSDETEAMYDYAMGGYQDVNDYLNEKFEGYNNTKDMIDKIDNSMDKYELAENVITYRGTDSKYYKDYNVGDIFPEKMYYSTSLNKNIAQKFAEDKKNPIVVEIRVPKGTRSIYIGDNTDYEFEAELLLSRNLTYKVIEKSDNNLILEVVNAEKK